MFWSGPKMPRNSSKHVRKSQGTREKAPLVCSEQVKQGPEDGEATEASRGTETPGAWGMGPRGTGTPGVRGTGSWGPGARGPGHRGTGACGTGAQGHRGTGYRGTGAQGHSGNLETSILAHTFSLPKADYSKGRRKSKQGV